MRVIVNYSSVPLSCSSGARHLAPRRKGSITEQPVMVRPHQMPPEPKEIVNGTVNREKPLGVARRLKPAHLAFLLSGWLM